ncbi:calcium-activated potassium channel subunit beta-1 isoform X1 [Felis catus]|uniref:Calcium-activated potassium channel subunit beta n=1 Tax=Felis catus TaxID=9685 RepID=A0ABI7YR14_FELCA|nr:calcium-activated potassium channel subunit beta-1 isoform X1 [Felis catus]XP_044891631.1 calcium-activated potassium channel subunit beta-1 isoform X1 [Felis catus]XP_044891636.1 calcium-activated potassium channel subunit beta-1 isoform X1 [Felis catus]
MGKKLVMAQKRGETRALCLGVAMVVCAVIAYYILGTTMLPLYQKSVWTQESTCHLIETNIRDQEELEGKKVPQYPCLWVNVSAVGRWAVLYHTEDTRDQNQQHPGLTRRGAKEAAALVGQWKRPWWFCQAAGLVRQLPHLLSFSSGVQGASALGQLGVLRFTCERPVKATAPQPHSEEGGYQSATGSPMSLSAGDSKPLPMLCAENVLSQDLGKGWTISDPSYNSEEAGSQTGDRGCR